MFFFKSSNLKSFKHIQFIIVLYQQSDYMIPYSILDLAKVSEGNSIPQTLQNSVPTAQLADQLGYKRYWFAEHHNIKNVTSAATSVLVGFIAGKTSKIRVGSGGVMLPNHSPLIIAEHFGTLASLYPNRIDLGIGRAPGTDQLTARTINPNFIENVHRHTANVQQLQKYFSKDHPHAKIKAYPGEGTEVPIWILGSSTDSAYLASSLGLPYAFASHFAPGQIAPAFDIYSNNFKSEQHSPYKMACVNVIISDTEKEAERQATTFYRAFLGLVRNQRDYLQPPIDSMDGIWNDEEKAHVQNMTSCSFVGTKEIVKQEVNAFINHFKLDEIMISIPQFDLDDKLATLDSFAEIMKSL